MSKTIHFRGSDILKYDKEKHENICKLSLFFNFDNKRKIIKY